jgi:hypothetical protein
MRQEDNAFKVNETYSCRSVCDYDCVWTFKVIKRTAKNVWLKDRAGSIARRAVKISIEDREIVWPFGHYSMAPILSSANMTGDKSEAAA